MQSIHWTWLCSTTAFSLENFVQLGLTTVACYLNNVWRYWILVAFNNSQVILNHGPSVPLFYLFRLEHAFFLLSFVIFFYQNHSIRIREYCESVKYFPKIAFYGFYVYWIICSWHTALSLVDSSVFCFSSLWFSYLGWMCWAWRTGHTVFVADFVCMCFLQTFFCEWIWLKSSILAKFLALYVMQSIYIVSVYAFRAYKSFWRNFFLSNRFWRKWKNAVLIRFAHQTKEIRHRNWVWGRRSAKSV